MDDLNVLVFKALVEDFSGPSYQIKIDLKEGYANYTYMRRF